MKRFLFLRYIVSVIVAVIITSILVYFVSSSKKLFSRHSRVSIESLAQEKARSIDAQVNYAENSIQLLSAFVSSEMKERELKNPNEVFSKYTKKLPFDLIEYVRWDGLNMMNSTKGEKPFDASQRPYYIEGIKGNSGSWTNFKPKASKEVLLNFYTPLYHNNEISGVITGAIGETSSLKPKLKSSFFGHEIQAFVCDENYVVISSACEDIYPGLDLKEWKDEILLKDFLYHSEKDVSEAFEYDINGKKGLCCSAKIPNKGWHVAVIAYPSVLDAVEAETSGNLVFVSSFIILIMILYLGISLYLQARANKLVQDKLIVAAIRDELIKAAALCIKKCYGQYGKTYRTGGDEFISILYASDEEIADIKEQFAEETRNWKGKYSSSLMIPAGIVTKKEMPDASLKEISKLADQRMYVDSSL